MAFLNYLVSFLFFSIILGALVLYVIILFNKRKDNKIDMAIINEIKMYVILEMKKGKSKQEAKDEYMNSLKGGILDNGRREERRRIELDTGTTEEPINSIKQTEGSNRNDKPAGRIEERRELQIDVIKQDRRADEFVELD